MSKLRLDEMKHELGQCLDAALRRLHQIWDDIGICDEQRRERADVVLLHLRNLLDEMVTEEEALKSNLMANVQRYGTELVKLCKELGVPHKEPSPGLTILQLEKELRLRVDNLAKEKHERVKKLKTLKEKDQHLCDILCTTPYYIPTGAVPTSDQLSALEQHVASLVSEKERRQAMYRCTRTKIVKLLEDLEQCPNSSFERDIVCEEEDSFLLSTENMDALKHLHQNLEQKQKDNKKLGDTLRERLAQLWERLMVPLEERDEFELSNEGHKPKILKSLQEEIDRCELLKSQNIQRVIESARKELVDWWDRCYCSKKERDQFVPYYDEQYTEELLEVHEKEVQKVKEYYEEHKDIIERVKRREELWTKMQEFEKRAADPNRFSNRGGNLLREEKARKKLMKDLPKVEEEVEELINEWEQKSGKAFLVDGVRFIDYVQNQWAMHQTQKEREKEMRHQAKSKTMAEEMIFGSKPATPAKRRFLGTPSKTPTKLRKLNESPRTPRTPNSTSKYLSIFHKLNDTNRTPGNSVRVNHSSVFMSPMRSGSRSASKRTPLNRSRPGPTPNRSTRSRKALSERNVSSPSNNLTLFSQTSHSQGLVAGPNNNNLSTITLASTGSYKDFANGLNMNAKTANVRSSIVPNATCKYNLI